MKREQFESRIRRGLPLPTSQLQGSARYVAGLYETLEESGITVLYQAEPLQYEPWKEWADLIMALHFECPDHPLTATLLAEVTRRGISDCTKHIAEFDINTLPHQINGERRSSWWQLSSPAHNWSVYLEALISNYMPEALIPGLVVAFALGVEVPNQRFLNLLVFGHYEQVFNVELESLTRLRFPHDETAQKQWFEELSQMVLVP
jgi:hypothetical protein